MTPQEMKALADGFVPAMHEIVNRAVAKAMEAERTKYAALELRLMELETRPHERVDIDALVTRVLSMVPKAQDGRTGPVGVTGAFVNRAGNLILTLSDGRTLEPGLVVGKDGRDGIDGKDGMPGMAGKDGRDGADGKDGLGFDSADLLCDDEKGWLIRLTSNGRTKEYSLPYPWDAGIWEAGRFYLKGAGVTHGGHFWIATNDAPLEPGEGSSGWRLVVRRGREGRQGKEGPAGRDGRDLTQMGPDGSKWR